MFSSRRYYFIAIAQTKNMTKAAEKLHVSQPSLSQYLKNLEKELDIRLVDRTSKKLELTEAGKEYYQYLLASRRQDQKLFRKLDELRLIDTSHLIVGLPNQKSTDVFNSFIPGFLNAYYEKFGVYPVIDCKEGTSIEIEQQVCDGVLELGFAHITSGNIDEDDFYVIRSEKVHLLCNKKNPLVSGISSSISKPFLVSSTLLDDKTFFQLPENYALHKISLQALEMHHIATSKTITLSSLQTIVTYIKKNPSSGFAFIPDFFFYDNEMLDMADDFAFLKLDEKELTWDFSILKNPQSELSANAQFFWDYIVSTA